MIPYKLFFMFFIYSFLGWVVETLYCSILERRWVNRGFMAGPYCPIYGFGSLIIIYALDSFKDNPIIVFLLAMLFTSILEYVTSFLLEKIFHAKWWDYSKRFLNINGRVCLLNSTEFGILGIILTYFVHPFILKQVDKIPANVLSVISLVLFVIMLVDFISTVFVLLNLKEKLELLKDLSKRVKADADEKKSNLYTSINEFKEKSVIKSNFLTERFLKAFPNFEFTDFKKQLEEFKEKHSKKKKDEKITDKEEKS